MHDTDLARLAKLLRRVADSIDDRGSKASRLARDWRGHLKGTNTDPGGGSSPDTPTERAAMSRDWTVDAYDRLSARCRNLAAAAVKVESDMARIVGTGELRTELEDSNTRTGDCGICGGHVTGYGSDRLRTRQPGRSQVRLCPVCWRDWQRKRGQDFGAWCTDRRQGVERDA